MEEINIRKQKLIELQNKNINPYPNKFVYTDTLSKIKSLYSKIKESEISQEKVSVCGRIIFIRTMGKATFLNILDATDKLQIYMKKDIVGEQSYNDFLNYVDIGDFIGVTGNVFRTRTGELTVNTQQWTMLSKALRNLPEKWHGLKDIETRYRQRYLDLIANPDTRKIFYTHAKIINCIREYLNKNDFLEVETPIIQNLAGGAIARPFKTYHNAYNKEFFLRIAPELYLKMLVVGGLEKIYELGKSFRNEGVDRRHNPEFTMVEIYKAYSDYNDMLVLCKEIIKYIVENLQINQPLQYGDKKINITNFNIISLDDIFKEILKVNSITDIIYCGEIKKLAIKLGIEMDSEISDKKIFEHIFSEFIQSKLIDPTFVIDYPSIYCVLAKTKQDNPKISERFELFIGTEEIANAYSELNNPEEQRNKFLLQKKDDDELHPFDKDFITSLEYGMPPCGGLGIGIDRLTMLLTNCESIREVILFPLLKPIED